MRAGMKNPLTRLNIKQQLILIFLVMAFPVFLLHWYSNGKAEQIMKRNVTNAYVELNKQNQILIGRDIDTVHRIMTTIIQNPVTQQMKYQENSVYKRVRKYTTLDTMLSAYSEGVSDGQAINYSLYVYDPGRAYFFAPQIPFNQCGVYFFSDQTQPEWFDEALKMKGKGYLKVIEQQTLKGPQKTLAYIRAVNTISDGRDAIGVLVATNMNQKIASTFESVSLPDGEIYYTDADNIVLTSNTMKLGTRLEQPNFKVGEAGSAEIIGHVDNDFIYVMNYSRPQQQLIYKIPVKALLLQQNELKRIIQLITIVYAVSAFVLLMYFWRSLLTPLQKLAMFVRSYVPGKIVPQTPGKGRSDEVGVLIASVYDMAGRLNSLIRDQYQQEIKQKEAQLQILYTQINPHLLYNTLESIYWKSALEGKTESAEMIKELSKLMRISLSKGRELITLTEELEHAGAYVRLQQKRYEYSFRMEWNVDEAARQCLIPKITLQPLIENAIIHGVRNMDEDGEIVVTAVLRDQRFYVTVEDNGYKKVDYDAIRRTLETESATKSGYGIRNIHQRLRLHFGKQYGLSYRAAEHGGTIVTVMMPVVRLDEPE
ncbi:sensor histidine kinase [Paenibacillus pinihumi]|uniref:sensor histidine kinase n=1 Tax=Paenibacillus pinihumi TaxID=669462 RepID=UPI00040628DF|nr:sensor histidine kinase [Paenibacillus pinihumi]